MGTTAEFNIPVADKDIKDLEKACDAAKSEISRLDLIFSIFDDSSEVSKINSDTRKKVVRVSQDLFRLVARAKEYFMLTQGAFDVTVEPLTEIWGFGPEDRKNPDTQTIKKTLQHVGLDKIRPDEDSQSLFFEDPKVRMDFGAIAKGYAADQATRIFKGHGITRALINIGGDLYCMGAGPKDEGWSIGIRNPSNKKETLARLKIRDKAIATSGSYENFYIYEDKNYGHIIDPRTGHTVSSGLTSVTIIADDCTTADVLATAVFVLGEEEGLELIEKLSGVECFLVVSRGRGQEVLTSNGMGKYLE